MTELMRGRGGSLATSDRPGFGAGIASFFGGFGFIVFKASMWPLAAVPIAIAGTVTGGLGYAAVKFIPKIVEPWFGDGIGGTVLMVIAVLFGLALSLLAGVSLAQPLAGPALNAIVRRAEAAEGAPIWPPTRFIDDMTRGLHSVLVAYGLGFPLLALFFVLSFTPVAPIAWVLKVATLAMMIAWDLCDYPLSLRGWPIKARMAFMRRHLGAVIGFGFGLALLSLLPCALLFVLPAGVAGAARLVARLERYDRSVSTR